MRKSLLLVVLLAACGQDAQTVLEPAAADALPNNLPSQTARVWIDGTEYEYGCPDFPCPVLPVVKAEVDKGNWFVVQPGTFPVPAIYLISLKTPIKLRLPPDDPPDPPIIQPLPPSLTGPADLIAKRLNISGQLTCSGFNLVLHSPDGGPWTFVSGAIESTYVEYDAATNSWLPSGGSHTWTLVEPTWNQLLAGTWTLFVSAPDQEFLAKVKVKLARGSTEADVEHSILCHLVPPPPPPAPELTGPTEVRGHRSPPDNILICNNIDLDLYVPDGGTWDFVSGKRTIEVYNWDAKKKLWIATGQVIQTSLVPAGWQKLLDGTYDIDPGVFTGPYLTTFTVEMVRGPYKATVSHTLACGGEDFFEQFRNHNGAAD